MIQVAECAPPQETKLISPDRRWFVTAESHHVVLVDLAYKHTPAESAWRIAKARFDPLWHQERASAACTAQDWYAAVFHFAVLLKQDPNQPLFHDGLHAAFHELQLRFARERRDVEPHLATVVREALKLTPGDQRVNPGFEEPRIRKAASLYHSQIVRPGNLAASERRGAGERECRGRCMGHVAAGTIWLRLSAATPRWGTQGARRCDSVPECHTNRTRRRD